MLGESRYANVNCTTVHYVVVGEGRPVLLLRGLGAAIVTWRDNIGPLSKAFRVYAMDLPGHGDSDKLDIECRVEAFISAALDFAESLGLDHSAIIGNSSGGALGLMMALRRPELVSSLVLVDSGSFGREVSPWSGF